YSPGCSLELKMRDLAGNIATARRPLFSERGTQGTKPSVEPTVAATTKPRVQRSDFLRDLNLWFVSFGSPDEGLEMMRTEVPAEAWSRFLREERGENVTFVDGRKPMTIGNRPVSLIQDFVRWFEKRSDDGYEYFVPTVEQWLTAFVDADSAEVARQRIDDWFTKEFRISLPPRELRYGENQSFPIGSRKMVETPGTGLLDMEANVQEIVRAAPGETVYVVIGGSNHHSSVEGLRNACLYHRTFDPDRQEIQGDRTGLRLCRRPARAR
ncbi:MAG TPA: hypothetical protein VK116_15760, partial [Planctomycetota bacterium]|nr:hypothetical protein [Planctomycetota bacterium]